MNLISRQAFKCPLNVITNLDTETLRTFVTAIDLGSFARAAERVGRSQSAVSLQMKRLEEQIGHPILRKKGRGLALTEAGDVVLAYARRILGLNDEALAAVTGAGAVTGTVRLGMPQDLAERWLPIVLARFSRAYPAVQIEARVERNATLLERLGHGQLDLALVFGETGRPGATPFAELPLTWIGLPGYRLEREAGRPLPLVVFEPPCQFRQVATDALERAKQPWRIVLTTPSLAGLWAAVEAGLGVTMRTPEGVPARLAMLEPRTSKLPTVNGARMALSLHTAHGETEQREVVRRLRAILLEHVNDLPHRPPNALRRDKVKGGAKMQKRRRS